MGKYLRTYFHLLVFLIPGIAAAQLSPGPLVSYHSHLEGLTNCTRCHELGQKVTNARCLACHTEVKARTDRNKGYHASKQVSGKGCVECHSDHHGLSFRIVNFNTTSFDHLQTGYRLEGAHGKQSCANCHKTDFISDNVLRKKKFTYLGLGTDCLNCHEDYHRKTLPPSCNDCHGSGTFKGAEKFSHNSSAFRLQGMHQQVPCIKCHPVTQKEGKSFQQFKGIAFANCTNCHADVHQNRFGQNCAKCHTEQSFHAIRQAGGFDHSMTGYKLEDKHLMVACSACHKTSLTEKLRHEHCTDCHSDYHGGQFISGNTVRDCAECHSVNGFNETSYSTNTHASSPFPLKGAHLATPCFSCHRKTGKWSFRQVGSRCADCHKNIHDDHISPKYFGGGDCSSCHNEVQWDVVSFDHSATAFPLAGAHAGQPCRKCHFPADTAGKVIQVFAGLPSSCSKCHRDIHFRQFERNGETECSRCHAPDEWRIHNFDHNTAAFRLEGRHAEIACSACHKTVTEGPKSYILYKIKDYRCESCH
jgi:hypothetical protein